MKGEEYAVTVLVITASPSQLHPSQLVLRARRGDTKEEGRYCAKGARKAGRDAVHQREEGDCEERAGVSRKGSGSGARKSDPQWEEAETDECESAPGLRKRHQRDVQGNSSSQGRVKTCS